MIGGDVSFYVKILRILTHPCKTPIFNLFSFSGAGCRKLEISKYKMEVKVVVVPVMFERTISVVSVLVGQTGSSSNCIVCLL